MTTAALDLSTLRRRLEEAWARSDELFTWLTAEGLHQRPIALRQPFIFYLGHLPAFAWNQVWRGVLGRGAFNASYDALFQRGIDPVGVDAYQGSEAWPRVDQVVAYRDRVRQQLRGSFEEVAELEGRDELADRGRIYQIVIEHEVMHHETLLYMFQQLPMRFKARPATLPAYRFGAAARRGVVAVSGGTVRMGARFEDAEFGWDNEFPEAHAEVAGFDMDRLPVSNGDWLEFLEAGGYARPELWDGEAWEWKERVRHAHPAFWVRDGGAWRYRTLFDELPLSDVPDWPVYVSWAEADAYARWRGGSLPTEAEFHRAAYGSPDGIRAYPWGDEPPSSARGNFGFAQLAPAPVGAFPSGASAWGALDLVGNGWEWTASRFAPFDGFRAYARTYPGYSADFFDGRHYVILGASYATDTALVRRSFRNWFQPHYPYVFAKFRCVRRA
jgi:ergothioneine biosynthesis protein EgtB